MGNKCASSLTTLETLDAMEAGISALRSWSNRGESPGQATREQVVMLHTELQAAGVSAAEFARATCTAQHDVEVWLAGTSPLPHWVPTAIRLMALLTPSARRQLLYAQAAPRRSRPIVIHFPESRNFNIYAHRNRY
jgi:hypothetical protein